MKAILVVAIFTIDWSCFTIDWSCSWRFFSINFFLSHHFYYGERNNNGYLKLFFDNMEGGWVKCIDLEFMPLQDLRKSRENCLLLVLYLILSVSTEKIYCRCWFSLSVWVVVWSILMHYFHSGALILYGELNYAVVLFYLINFWCWIWMQGRFKTCVDCTQWWTGPPRSYNRRVVSSKFWNCLYNSWNNQTTDV